jgi:DNA-binding LytR/AlgR family response regulator
MKCLAIDDEPLALDLLEDNIRRTPGLELVGTFSSALEANRFLQTESVDLLFLDIQMPGITGVQFVQGLVKRPMVIFVTAYEQFAMDGFNLDVVDYLLKPVAYERFLRAVNKAQEKLNTASTPFQGNDLQHIFVNSEYSMVRIDLDDVIYIEGLKDYIKIFLASNKWPVITRMSMKGIEEKLDPRRFIRVHKSYIVSIKKIVSVRKSRIVIAGKDTLIPVSDFYKEAFNRIVNPGADSRSHEDNSE